MKVLKEPRCAEERQGRWGGSAEKGKESGEWVMDNDCGGHVVSVLRRQ